MDVSGEATIGISAGVEATMGGIAKLTAKGSLVDFQLAEVNYDVINNDFTGSNIFDGNGKGVKVKQNYEISLSLIDKRLTNISTGIQGEHSWYARNSGYKDYSSSFSFSLIKPIYESQSGTTIMKSESGRYTYGSRPNGKFKITDRKIGFEFGAQFILGGKIGINLSYDKSK